MQFRTNPKNGDQLSALGFGCMRFPGMPARIDFEATEKLILTAVEQGVNYLDTAYIYTGSEAALGDIFTRNPGLREKVKLATKLPILKCSSMADFDTYLNRSLERLKVDSVDYYLIHNLTSFKSWEHLVEIGVEEWIAKQQEAGRIINIGFSFHGPEGDFEPLLDAYAWDFCQIQYNYLNEHYQAGTAGLKAAAARGIPVIVMEPLLGGKLAAPLPEKAQAVLTEEETSTDPVRLALRWLWDKPEVTVVLSGMNALSQLEENIATANDANPGCLTETEIRAVDAARAAVAESYKIPCTGCGYCMPCPRKVDIPGCFNAYNASFAHGWFQGVQQYVTASGALSGKLHLASDCTQCGACAKRCPQHIDIPKELGTVKRRLQIPGLATILKVGLRFIVR
ncbi:MAG: aldo/keto reductase [Eggerthellaceae bacterium]|nr:aldo/keto reductase [Eggerthellaceae bacterium]